ncbi:MAG: hypothetical protein K2U26_16410, partial [Cyclobacteriaceae bacterium]|nr:hypothetical protein [Cyclobacteriaceae bacterium]
WAVYTNNDYSKLLDWNPVLSAQTLKESQVKGLYTLPDLRDEFLERLPKAYQIPPVSNELMQPMDSTVQHQFTVYSTTSGKLCGVRKGWALAKGRVTKRNVFVLKNSARSYFFSTAIEYRGDLSDMMMAKDPLDKTNYSDSGFNVCVTTSDLSKGEYWAGILLQTWDGLYYYIQAPDKIIVK